MLVRPGDRVPLDGEVERGRDPSGYLGCHRRAGPGPRRPSATGQLPAASTPTAPMKIRVTHVLAESMVQRILDSVENAAARKPKIDRFITRFSRVYTPAVVAIALLTAIVPEPVHRRVA